jgi:hypothetical protein
MNEHLILVTKGLFLSVKQIIMKIILQLKIHTPMSGPLMASGQHFEKTLLYVKTAE